MISELKSKLEEQKLGPLSSETEQRLLRLFEVSPLYHRTLLNHPDYIPWLEKTLPFEEGNKVALQAGIAAEWKESARGLSPYTADYLDALRRFRRRMCLRFAYREVNRIVTCEQSVLELSVLAGCCIRECYALAYDRWLKRYGEPWDEELNKRARFCVLALGKLGGRELNFSSDIDLIYFYEGEGHCRKAGKSGGSFTNQQFFTKIGETLTSMLQEQNEFGFLYRTDLRLRPEGARSPLVRSFAAMEHYYAAAGQSWERMALIKARAVAGDRSLGGELMETLHSFRYPRHAPPTLLTEIAAMKTRTEREVVGAKNLNDNIKSGYGGIREIEFVVQTMQLLHAGRNPFLQTHSTVEGLRQLARYGFIEEEDAERLTGAYWLLRAVENRLQMRQERQTHVLPSDADNRAALARSFGFGDWESFLNELDAHRKYVRGIYTEIIPSTEVDEVFDAWWSFFSSDKIPSLAGEKLEKWFPSEKEAATELRAFVLGESHRRLSQDQVTRFQNLVETFDKVLPGLASPFRVLRRISSFAGRYGTPTQFLHACSANTRFFQVLALLFDRSRFIYETLCRHPEIFDEVLRPEILKRKKSVEETLAELRAANGDRELRDWLWIYVRAEQIRLAIGELLEFNEAAESVASLTVLADAVVTYAIEQFNPPGDFLPVALGKYGGNELTFGADLDLIFIGQRKHLPEQEKAVQKFAKLLSTRTATESVYEIDLRLRPHGKAGPLVTTLSALKKYHSDRGAGQGWEKQMLTRARVVGDNGNSGLAGEFHRFIEDLLYTGPLPAEEVRRLWRLRLRIQNERDQVDPPERAFKTAAGGLIDLEFLAQFHQLRLGYKHPSLRMNGTRPVLEELVALRLIPKPAGEAILSNFDFLKRIEGNVRRDLNKGSSVIPEDPHEQAALAKWMKFPDRESFWDDYTRRLRETRRIFLELMGGDLGIPLENGGD